jgi:hypothetical protein
MLLEDVNLADGTEEKRQKHLANKLYLNLVIVLIG